MLKKSFNSSILFFWGLLCLVHVPSMGQNDILTEYIQIGIDNNLQLQKNSLAEGLFI